MPIVWRMHGTRIDIVFTDPYTLAESEKVMKEIFAERSLRRPLRFLVDVRNSTAPDVEFVGNAVTFWQMHLSLMWGAKIAVVVETDAQLRMGRLSEDSVESRELPFTIRAFPASDVEAATAWLAE